MHPSSWLPCPPPEAGKLVGRARRAALLVDGDNYFAAFARAALKARRHICIAGWEFASRVRLLRGREGLDFPDRLGEFLDRLVGTRPELRIHILAWDHSLLFSLEREPLTSVSLGLASHRNIHFTLDAEHPLGASHHQKIVVIDGDVAFCGGLDLTQCRWDTRRHEPDDPLRVSPLGEPYAPFHDVQILVDAEPARALLDVFLQRWERATGRGLKLEAQGGDPWPEDVNPDFHDAPTLLSLTLPEFKRDPARRELETLHVWALEQARRNVYIENQYFTAPVVQQTIARRLAEPEGPEILALLPKRSMGWLEEQTMDALRARLVRELLGQDPHGRLSIRCPDIQALGDKAVKVHSKLFIVDDALLHVGSANLTNRSMGLDSECGLTLLADREELAAGVRRVRADLLAEHLPVDAPELERAIEERGLLSAVAEYSNGERRLAPLPLVEIPEIQRRLAEVGSLDLEKPLPVDQAMDEMVEDKPGIKHLSWIVLVLFLILAALAWRFTPLSEYLDKDALVRLLTAIRAHPGAVWIMLGCYVVGGLVVFPVTLLITVTAVVFPPVVSFCLAIGGSMLSAALTFGLGQLLGRPQLDRMDQQLLRRIREGLARRGVIASAVFHMVPVAPFTLINVVAGASGVRFRDFMIGTLLGMLPGTLAITLLTKSLLRFLNSPDLGNLAWLAAVAALAILSGLWVKKRLAKRKS